MKNKSTWPFRPEWFVYTNDPATFDHITGFLRASGERQDDALMTDQRVSDRSDLVTLRAIKAADKQTLDKAAIGQLKLVFQIYLRQYPGGPIQHFESQRKDAQGPKIVLLVSNTLTEAELRRKALDLKKEHPTIEYVLADEDMVGVVDAMINRGFVNEVGLFGGDLGKDNMHSLAYQVVETARKRSVSVRSMDEAAAKAISAWNGSSTRGKSAAQRAA